MKTGRPRKQVEPMNVSIRVRFTVEQMAQLKQEAQRNGFGYPAGIGDYIRCVLFTGLMTNANK